MFTDYVNEKERKDDRILVIRPKDGTKTKSSTGLFDPRLFNGQNRLHVIKNNRNIWYFKYDQGGLPEPLKQQFTTFELAYNYAKKYLGSRNVEITEIID